MSSTLQIAPVSEASTTPLADRRGPILSAIIDARSATDEILSGGGLDWAAAAIVAVAQREGHHYLHGVSSAGHCLVGAAALHSHSLRPWVEGSETPVLLVDGFVAGFTGLEASAARALAVGAHRVDAVLFSKQDARPVVAEAIARFPGRLFEVPPRYEAVA